MFSAVSLTIIVILAIACGVLFYLYKKESVQCKKLKTGVSIQKSYLQNMSHEIRTPLNAICGFSQILCNPEMKGLLSDEEIAEYGIIIQSNTDMLSTLVGDILDIGDMESGKYRLSMGNCNVNDVCRKAISTVIYRCPDSVKMYMTSDVADDYIIHSDAKRVEQVIINYLTNAVKHTMEGEIHLHVSLSENAGMVTFSVTDTGEGVPADKADIIFGRFEKLETFKQGTGLGLAICRSIAEQLGGEAKLDINHQGKGARFLFTHPVKQGS